MSDDSRFWGLGMVRASDTVYCHGCGTTSFDGLMYDSDGRPLVGLALLITDHDGKDGQTPIFVLTLENAGSLIAELTNRIEVMGYDVALRHHIEQHRAGLKANVDPGAYEGAGVVCGYCGGRPGKRTGDGPVGIEHQPGCENASPS